MVTSRRKCFLYPIPYGARGADVVIEARWRRIPFPWPGSAPAPMPWSPLWRCMTRPRSFRSGDVRENLTFQTGGVDGCDVPEILALLAQGKLDTTPLITHTPSLEDIEAAYAFEHHRDGVISGHCSSRMTKSVPEGTLCFLFGNNFCSAVEGRVGIIHVFLIQLFRTC